MKKRYTLLASALLIFITAFSQTGTASATQNTHIQDSIKAALKDSLRIEKLKAVATFPLFNAGPWSGVLPVEGVDEKPDPKREYKLLFELTYVQKDTSHANINDGLVEIARKMNLHIASGIPLNHIHPIIVVHGQALFSILSNDAYRAKYKKDNPNIKLMDEMMKAGIKFIACGQAMGFLEVNKSQLYPGVKVSVTAQTVLSNYVTQGYMLYVIDDLD